MDVLGAFKRLVGDAAHGAQQAVQAVGNVERKGLQTAGNAAAQLFHPQARPQPQQQPTQPMTDLQNPTSLSRIKGTVLAEGVGDRAGYTPSFRGLVQSLHPAVVEPQVLLNDYPGVRRSAAGGDFNGEQIKINSMAPDQGEILTHEAIHGANARNPQMMSAYQRLQGAASPRQRVALRQSADGSNSYAGVDSPERVADESLAYGSGLALQNNRGGVADTYAPYFRSRDPQSFTTRAVYAPMIARNAIDRLLGLGDWEGYKPQFSDWQDN